VGSIPAGGTKEKSLRFYNTDLLMKYIHVVSFSLSFLFFSLISLRSLAASISVNSFLEDPPYPPFRPPLVKDTTNIPPPYRKSIGIKKTPLLLVGF